MFVGRLFNRAGGAVFSVVDCVHSAGDAIVLGLGGVLIRRLMGVCFRVMQWLREPYFLKVYLPGFYGPFNPLFAELAGEHASRNAWIMEADNLPRFGSFHPYFHVCRKKVSHLVPGWKEVVLSVIEAKSLQSVYGKWVNIWCYSFNGNRLWSDGERWKPANIGEISETAWSVIDAFQKGKGKVDVLCLFSLGSITLHDLPKRAARGEAVPTTIVLDRCLASSKKSASKVFYFRMVGSFVHAMAYYCGWSTNPEQDLGQYYQNHGEDGVKRSLIRVEAKHDHFLSEGAGFASTFVEEAKSWGVKADEQVTFTDPTVFYQQAHHSLSWEHLKNTEEETEETMAAFFFRRLIGEGRFEGDFLNILFVGGSLDNSDSVWTCRAEPFVNCIEEAIKKCHKQESVACARSQGMRRTKSVPTLTV